jgi:hypothetical protein
VTSSRKGAKSRTPKAKTRVASSDDSQTALIRKLKAHAGDLEKELKTRTYELVEARGHLSEALEQQTATSEVLRVISSSPGDLVPVFQAMLANAVRLCTAKFGVLFLHEGRRLRMVASHDVPPAYAEARRQRGLYQGAPLGDVVRTKQTVHVEDIAATQAYLERHPAVVEAVELGGIRTWSMSRCSRTMS